MNDNQKEVINNILTENGLDFDIIKLPLVGQEDITVIGETGDMMETTKIHKTPYFGLLNEKSGEIINTVKGGYHVSQNKDIVELVVQGMQPFGGELSVQKAGSLHGGRRTYLQLQIDGHGKVGNDTVKRYVTIIDSNDGSSGLAVGIGDFTMSCSNQFFHFYKSGQAKFRHTASLEHRVKEIPSLIKMALSESLRMVETYKNFQSTSISRNLAHKMVNHVLGFDKVTSSIKELNEKSTKSMNAMDTLYDNIEKEMNSKGNNVWGLHSGVTRWTTHEKSAPRRENGRIQSIMVGGTNYKTNQKSLEYALSLV